MAVDSGVILLKIRLDPLYDQENRLSIECMIVNDERQLYQISSIGSKDI